MRHWLASAVIFAVSGVPVTAQQVPADVETLFDLLGQHEIIDVMREEGLGYGDQVAEMMFGVPADPSWDRQLERIYDREMMHAKVLADFASALENTDLAPIISFFESDLGTQIVDLEVSARRAMLGDQVTEAAKIAAADALAAEDPRMAVIQEFIQVNDLVEMNVVGGMNGNYAFYMGLLDGGGLGQITADMVLSDVMGQEEEIRISTTDWINGFLYLAYGPLEIAEIETYTAFSETDAGQALNTALFSAYDDLFSQLNYSIGAAAAQRLNQSEL